MCQSRRISDGLCEAEYGSLQEFAVLLLIVTGLPKELPANFNVMEYGANSRTETTSGLRQGSVISSLWRYDFQLSRFLMARTMKYGISATTTWNAEMMRTHETHIMYARVYCNLLTFESDECSRGMSGHA